MKIGHLNHTVPVVYILKEDTMLCSRKLNQFSLIYLLNFTWVERKPFKFVLL